MPTLDKKEFIVIPSDVYRAEIVSIKQVTGRYGEQLEWVFEIPEQETSLTGWCSLTYSDRSKFGKWVKAMFGDLPPTIDTDDLIGETVHLRVSVQKRADESEYNKVEKIVGRADGPIPPRIPEFTQTDEIPF